MQVKVLQCRNSEMQNNVFAYVLEEIIILMLQIHCKIFAEQKI